MCRLATGFLLIISTFLAGRSYKEVLYQGKEIQVYLEGKITDKQYKDSGYGGYWQVTLKRVKVLCQEEENNTEKVFQSVLSQASLTEENNFGKTENLEGKYLCQISSAENIDLKIGQQILLTGKYTPWEEPTNPGQFNLGKYYCSQGILGQFRKCKVIKQGISYSGFREGMWKIRQEADYLLRQELGEEDGALISAMLLGEKSGLNEEDKNLYQRNGISHILAISGLHLMLLGMGVFQVLKVILGNRPGAVLSIILMSTYCVFTGNSISTIRATIMFALSVTARLLGRSYDSLSALGIAAILQLFINPYVLNNSGFLLSFLAVIGVTFIAPKLQEMLGAKKKIAKSLCVSISSSIATLPVLLCNYGTYPWYSVFLNLFILPAMSVLLFLAVVLVVISLPSILAWEIAESGVGEAVHFVIDIVGTGIKCILGYFEICCRIFEHLPFQDGYIGAPNGVQIVLYAVLVFVSVSGMLKYSAFARKMILLSAVSILTAQFNFGTEITMLDVGQGDSIVIRNSNGNVFISDCGSSSVSKVGKYRLIPFLKNKGYGKIKGVFISHLDQDHMNGIMELLEMAPEENIEISYLFLPESVLWIEEDKEIVTEIKEAAEENKTKVVYLKQGDRMKDGFMEFLCLYPVSAETRGIREENRNNQSLVLFMTYEDFEILLTGDVEKQGEMEIVEYIDRMSLQAGDVLKAAHHGSSGSSSEEFLEVTAPKLTLISCGKNNSYGHPHEETLERLEQTGSKIMSTADSGAISIKVNREKVTVEKYVSKPLSLKN